MNVSPLSWETGAGSHLQSWWCHPSVVVAYIVQVFLVAPPVHWGHGVDLCRPMPSQDEALVWLDFLCPPLQDGGRVVPRDMGSDRCQIVGRCGRARFSVTVTTCGVLHTRRLHIRERLRYISSARGLGGGGSQMCGMSPFQGPCGGAWGSFGGALGLWCIQTRDARRTKGNAGRTGGMREGCKDRGGCGEDW